MEIIWLKRDVRLNDHGPFAQVAKSNRPLFILYNYEPDQLVEHSVHGSHVSFVNEGLIDLDRRLSFQYDVMLDHKNPKTPKDNRGKYSFEMITVCHAGIVYTLNSILKQAQAMECGGIHRILTHEETGHLKSYARDKVVRRWCKLNSIPIVEYNQTGVTRCLKSRDDFSKNFQAFVHSPLWDTPTQCEIECMQRRLVKGLKLHGYCQHPLYPHLDELLEIPPEHRADRLDRQRGGEGQGLAILESFLNHRGRFYASGISSPNTSWTTGGRISPYLTWGHLSTRYVISKLREKQDEWRQRKKASSKILDVVDGPWLRSLAAFSSRMHWRSHFIQKLESEPYLEVRDLCEAYQGLRRQPGDWKEEYYEAWATGHTGFPFVDACMRCLIRHGWLNFRMRAMLVSFATYNLWLDWKRIAPHLARLFLDYEPGIHYPQLQMQAGTTGINAMRVYNVTKQGRDQDPEGVFIKKYVPELKHVPTEYIHEPSKMSRSMQEKCCVIIGRNGNEDKKSHTLGQPKLEFTSSHLSPTTTTNNDTVQKYHYYPFPIVDEKQSATRAKDMVSSVRKQESTKQLAEKVYIKHGSRSSRHGNMDGVKPKALSSSIKRVKTDQSTSQRSIQTMFQSYSVREESTCAAAVDSTDSCKNSIQSNKLSSHPSSERANSEVSIKDFLVQSEDGSEKKEALHTSEKSAYNHSKEWTCKACTFINDKPLALSCLICGTIRK
jgi:deoxyribodipyrimidine photo-lyase